MDPLLTINSTCQGLRVSESTLWHSIAHVLCGRDDWVVRGVS